MTLLSTLDESEIADFESAIVRHKRNVAEFTLRDEPLATSSGSIEAVNGQVRVIYLPTNLSRVYSAGHGSNWLIEFERDLQSDVFLR